LNEAHAKARVTKAARASERTKSTLFARLRRSHASQPVMVVATVFTPTMLAARTPGAGEGFDAFRPGV